jgi:ATP-dependent protease ClpP protease subunit/phage major head subunit gpT-like protein
MSTATWYSIRRRSAVAAAAAVAAGAALAAAAASAEIWIYADIGESWWEETVSAKTLCKEIAELDVSQITVRINSFGGSVSDGIAIYHALKRHPAQVTTCADGIAASVASVIFQAGDRREIAEGAQVMVHAPWTYAAGNAFDLREAADMLDSWSTGLAQIYATGTGKATDAVAAEWLDGKDHWFTAAEAVAQGLADEVVAGLPVQACATRFDWTAQRAALQQPVASAAAAATPPGAPMPQATNPAANTQAATVDVQAAIRAENQRQLDIRNAFKVYARAGDAEAAQLLDACLADTEIDVVKAKAKLLEVQAKGTAPVAGGYVATLEDEHDKQRTAVRAALEIRAHLAKNDTANPYRSYSLVELARASLARAGLRELPGDKMSLIALAFTHSTSDFPLLLANTAQKAMMKGYDEADETFQVWTTAGSLPDFKVQSTVDLGSFPALRKVGEGAEYKYITVGERREQRVLATYGERFAITRQAIINDDVDAFSRLPRKMGRAAIRTVGDLAYAVLTANANMADGVALFHASHGNLQTAAVPSTATIDQMRVAMARQKDVGQTTGSLNIRMRYAIVPVTLQGAANVVRDSEFEVGGTSTTKANTVPNSVRNTFEVVSDARLDDASTTIYYGAADPAMHDTVVVDYLDGNQAPTLEQQGGWAVDGTEFKVRMDASAKALDWKTLQRNG